MAERNVSLLEDSVTGLKTSNGLKLSSVTGGTSTDNAIVRFDGTTGNVQNSGVVIDDSGRVGIGTSNTSGFKLETYGKGAGGNSWGENLVQFADGTTNNTGLRVAVNGTTSGLTQLVAATNNDISQFGFWTYNGTSWGERLRIDASGNVGIDTSSPVDKLHIENTNGTQGITLNNTSASGANGIVFKNSGTPNWALQALNDSSKAMRIYDYVANAERLRIDSAGNVGIGVTPSAWSAVKALQLGGSGAIQGDENTLALSIGVKGNIYTGFGSQYATTGQPVATYSMNKANGGHQWQVAPSGTAGNDITWTKAMTLGSNGNLLVGTSTDNGVDKLQVNGRATFGVKTVIPITGTTTGVVYTQSISYNRGIVLTIEGQNYQGTSAVFSYKYLIRNVDGTSINITQIENYFSGSAGSSGITVTGSGTSFNVNVTATTSYGFTITIN